MTASGKRRLTAVGIGTATVMAGLAMRFALPRSAATDIGGDALYAVLVYAAMVFVAPRTRPATVALAAGAICAAIELLQLTGLPRAWAASFPPIALVLGTGFDARDIIVYLAAVTIAAVVDLVTGRRRSLRTAGRWSPRAGIDRNRRG